MTYDGDFMRRKRQEGAATANYLWDGAQVLAETDGSNATVARYTLAPFGYGDLVAQRRSAASWEDPATCPSGGGLVNLFRAWLSYRA